MKRHLIITSLVLLGHLARGVPLDDNQEKKSNLFDIKNLARCSTQGGVTGVVNCAASRVLRSIEKAENEQVLEILPGFTLTSDESTPRRTAKELKLPEDPNQRASTLLDLLLSAVTRLFSSRTLKFKLPSTTPESLARSLEEGRGKMKKMMGPLLLGLGAKMITIVPIMLGGLALLASKALLIGKLSLVVSIILFVQYFFKWHPHPPHPYPIPLGPTTYGAYGPTYGSNSLGGWGTSQIPYGAPYARSINVAQEVQDDSKTAQDLAYSSHS